MCLLGGRAIHRSDAEGLRKSAHALKGAAANLSAGRAVEVALRLENIGRNADLSGAAKAFALLESESQKLGQELRRMLAAKRAKPRHASKRRTRRKR